MSLCPNAGITSLTESCLVVELGRSLGPVHGFYCLQLMHPSHSQYPWPVTVWRLHPSPPYLHGPTLRSRALRGPRPGSTEHWGSGNSTPLSPHASLIFASSSFAFQILLHHYHVTDPLRCLPLGLHPALLHQHGGRLRGPDGPGCPAERGLEGTGSQGRTTPD